MDEVENVFKSGVDDDGIESGGGHIYCTQKPLSEVDKQVIKESLIMQLLPYLQQLAIEAYPNDQAGRQSYLHSLKDSQFEQYLRESHGNQMKHQSEQATQINKIYSSNNQETKERITAYAIFSGASKELQIFMPSIYAASMWEKPGVKEFKESVIASQDSNVKVNSCRKIVVSSGETVDVRVPISMEHTAICWEFATDNYDIGFGLVFEWSLRPTSTISIELTDSSSDEEIDEFEDHSTLTSIDHVEDGIGSDNDKNPTDDIISTYRRDCFQHVCVGYHAYPGIGTYLFKFDNSYSLWRSKNVYYRIVHCEQTPVTTNENNLSKDTPKAN